MHDRLFAHQDALGRAALSSYAAFDAAVDATHPALRAGAQAAGGAADPVGAVIEADGEAARTLGLTGTPSFFVNGRKLVGARPVEDFARLVDEELARKR